MIKFETIKTKRLILRRLNDNDINNLFIMRSDEVVNKYVDVKLDESPKDTKLYLDRMNQGLDNHKWLIWGIEYNNELIGTISLWNFSDEQDEAEFGYGLLSKFQNHGFMKEALESIINYSFTVLQLKTLYAYTSHDNRSSLNLLVKSGFTYIKTIIEEGYYKKQNFEEKVFQLKKDR